jgi:hypothetical protein
MAKSGAVNSSPDEQAQPGQDSPVRSSDNRPAARVDSPEAEVASGEQRHALIAAAAYYLAERRGFAPGCELEDWLAAEVEVDALLKPAPD